MTSQRECPIGNYEKLYKNDFDSCQDVLFSCCVKDGPLSRFTRPEQTKMQRLDAQSANCAHIPIFQIFSNKTSRLVLSSELLHFVFLFYLFCFVCVVRCLYLVSCDTTCSTGGYITIQWITELILV